MSGPGPGSGSGPEIAAAQRAAADGPGLTVVRVLVLRFFNYRVVPDIPSLISSLEKRPRNGLLISQNTNRRHESA